MSPHGSSSWARLDGISTTPIPTSETTIRRADSVVVVSGTPHDLARHVDLDRPVVRVRYELDEREPTLAQVMDQHAARLSLDASA